MPSDDTNRLLLIDPHEPYQPIASPVLDKPRAERNELAEYWRAKYDDLRDESTPATIASLRAQLVAIKCLADEGGEDALARIAAHAQIGLAVGRT